MLTAWGTADEVSSRRPSILPSMLSRSPTSTVTRPARSNSPRAGAAFFDKVDIEEKKLLEYNVSTFLRPAAASSLSLMLLQGVHSTTPSTKPVTYLVE